MVNRQTLLNDDTNFLSVVMNLSNSTYGREKVWKFRNHRKRNKNPCDFCKARKRCCERINPKYCIRCYKAKRICTYKFNSFKAPEDSENSEKLNIGRESIDKTPNESRGSLEQTNTPFVNSSRKQDEENIGLISLKDDGLISNIANTQSSVQSYRLSKEKEKENPSHNSDTNNFKSISSEGLNSTQEMEKDFEVLHYLDKDSQFLIDISEKFGNNLLNLYFVFVNPFLPVISWKQFHRFMGSSNTKKWQTFPLLLLGSIYLQALKYWDKNVQLKNLSPPDSSKIFTACFNLTLLKYQNITNDEQENIILLQCCLLQIPFTISTLEELENSPEIVAISKLLNICHYLVENLRLGVNFLKKNLNNIFREDSDCFALNNIWWVYYIEEKWFTILTNKQTSIYDVNFDFIEDLDELPNSSYVETSITKSDTPNHISEMEEYVIQVNFVYRPFFTNIIKITIICSEITHFWYSILDYKFEKYGIKENFDVLINIIKKSNSYMEKIDSWWKNINDSLKGGNCGQFRKFCLDASTGLTLFYEIAKVIVFKMLIKKFILFSLIMNSTACTSEESEIMSKFSDVYYITKLKVADYFKNNFDFLKSLINQEFNSFWYPFSNYQLSFVVIFLSLFNFSLRSDVKEFSKNKLIISETELLISSYKEILEDGSQKWKFLRLPRCILKNLTESAWKEVPYSVERFKFSGIINDHAIEHFLMSGLPKCIILEKVEETEKIRELESLQLNDIESVKKLNRNIENFLYN